MCRISTERFAGIAPAFSLHRAPRVGVESFATRRRIVDRLRCHAIFARAPHGAK
jgi:hypothetical protein